MGAKVFSQAEIDQAKRLFGMGYNIGRIAREMGRSRSGVERVLNNPFSLGRTCSDCPAPISDVGKSGRCRACNTARNNKNPEITAKRMAGRRRAMADPIKYARACQVAKNNIRKAMADPAKRAKAVERGKIKAGLYFNTPEGRAWCNRPEVRQRAAHSLRERLMGWCPPEYRELYAFIMRQRNCTAAEARQMIADQIAADKAREEANLSPFQRQERALANGARLVANDRAPMFGEARRSA